MQNILVKIPIISGGDWSIYFDYIQIRTSATEKCILLHNYSKCHQRYTQLSRLRKMLLRIKQKRYLKEIESTLCGWNQLPQMENATLYLLNQISFKTFKTLQFIKQNNPLMIIQSIAAKENVIFTESDYYYRKFEISVMLQYQWLKIRAT